MRNRIYWLDNSLKYSNLIGAVLFARIAFAYVHFPYQHIIVLHSVRNAYVIYIVHIMV